MERVLSQMLEGVRERQAQRSRSNHGRAKTPGIEPEAARWLGEDLVSRPRRSGGAGKSRVEQRPAQEAELLPCPRVSQPTSGHCFATVPTWTYGLDLSSYEEVKARASEIYARLVDASMPCDEPWPPERLGLFRLWIDEGFPP